MRKRLFHLFLFLTLALGCGAQSQQELRDSLSTLIQQINRYPNDQELRFRKAAVNLLLEQWNYAIDEYTFILKKPITPRLFSIGLMLILKWVIILLPGLTMRHC